MAARPSRRQLPGEPGSSDRGARRLAERTALCWQAALLVQHAPAYVSETFLASRLGSGPAAAFGSLGPGTAFGEILHRALPEKP